MGVLIEVPVMLSVVKIVNATRVWHEAPIRATMTVPR
jgi:ACR3 family arsenite efflux pump ArsB